MKALILIAVLVSARIILPAQDQSQIPQISNQMASYFSYNPCEKVFMMTDKVTYRPGETVWFRAMVTDVNNRPAPNELDELIVQLCDKKGNPALQEIFRLDEGSAHGDLTIPENLGKGTYFMVAYASMYNSPEDVAMVPVRIDPAYGNQWVAETADKDGIFLSGKSSEILIDLRNVAGNVQKNTQLRYQLANGTDVIEKGKLKTDEKGKTVFSLTIPDKTNGEPFVCTLSNAKDNWTHQIFLPTNLDPVLIRFYPEGGNLIPGVPAKVGFTAFNKWGVPVDVEGTVVNQEGKTVALVKTLTKGLGIFSVSNDGKQNYKLLISGKTGQDQSFGIPAPNPDGLAFSIVKTDTAFISTSLIFANRQKHPVTIAVTQGSNFHWAADMEIDGAGRIKIPAGNLPHGINLVSVFSDKGRLLAERIVFQDRKQNMKIDVQPQENSLEANGSTRIKVRLTDENNNPLSGNVTVSVTDHFRNGTDRQRIDEFLQIDSKLENPFSLISSSVGGKIESSALMDIFLIANRMKFVDWDKISLFKPENASLLNVDGTRISGYVTDKNGKAVSRAKVSMVNNKTMHINTATTNADGVFSFPNLSSANIGDFSAQANGPDGKRELEVVFNKNFEGQLTFLIAENALKYSMQNAANVPDAIYFRNNPDLLVKAPKPIQANTTSLDMQRKLLSTSTDLLDVIKIIKPYQIMNGQIVFMGSVNSLNFQSGALIVVDGQQLGTNVSAISNISPLDVDHINVSTNPSDVQRYTGFNPVGVIEIFTKRGNPVEAIVKEESTVRYNGKFRIPETFTDKPLDPKHDMRTTLIWIPELEVDASGQAVFSLNSGNVLSDFIIEVQGISTDGRTGHAEAEFSVVK